jgi:hypothetical protein
MVDCGGQLPHYAPVAGVLAYAPCVPARFRFPRAEILPLQPRSRRPLAPGRKENEREETLRRQSIVQGY